MVYLNTRGKIIWKENPIPTAVKNPKTGLARIRTWEVRPWCNSSRSAGLADPNPGLCGDGC